MTTADLHKILDDENRKLSLAELKQVIYEMKQDAFNEYGKAIETKSQNRQDIRNVGFYSGEQNAFQIVLDLLEHCDDLNGKAEKLIQRLEEQQRLSEIQDEERKEVQRIVAKLNSHKPL